MKAFKQKCIALRRQDYSLNEIVRETNRPKTSVYFHIKDISLSDEKKKAIVDNYTERIVKLNHLRKGKSVFNRHPIIFSEWTLSLVSAIAHLLFDGEIKYGACVYNNRSKILIETFKKNMTSIYPYKSNEFIQKNGVKRISYFNVELASYLKQKANELLKNIEQMSIEHQRIFLKAFFDDEGCMDFNSADKTRRVRGYQYNDNMLRLIQQLLTNFDIESKINSRFNEIVISKRDNIERFAKEINFSHGVCVNGNRSNSIWKQHLEKREILSMALASYLD